MQQIIDKNIDPDQELLYNPLAWTDANNVPFSATENWSVLLFRIVFILVMLKLPCPKGCFLL